MNHTFKENDIAYFFTGFKIKLRAGIPGHLQFEDETGAIHNVQPNGCKYAIGMEIQYIYPYPVKVVPIPEFEMGENVVACMFEDFHDDNTILAKYVVKLKDDEHVVISSQGIDVFRFIRKITKPEKTIEELKDELIVKQKEYYEFLWSIKFKCGRKFDSDKSTPMSKVVSCECGKWAVKHFGEEHYNILRDTNN